jgi:hypothetical protein
MSQRAVEAVIGRLVTDEVSRREFREAPGRAVEEIASAARGELTPGEQAALASMPPDTWDRVARWIDPRLQRAALGDGRPLREGSGQ